MLKRPTSRPWRCTSGLYQGDHPEGATSLSSLGNDLMAQGEHERARELHEQALAMRHRLTQPSSNAFDAESNAP
jgi:hypothetical protein